MHIALLVGGLVSRWRLSPPNENEPPPPPPSFFLIRVDAFPVQQLGSNALVELPDDIEFLGCLETLSVFDNAMPTLPTTITNLTSLTALSVGYVVPRVAGQRR